MKTTHPFATRRDPWAAVLGAGSEQLHAMRTARELGVRLVAFDRNPQAPGLALADAAIGIDPANSAAVVERCREYGVSFLLPTPMGSLLAVAGTVNAALRLPGISPGSAELCADKVKMRERLAGAGLVQPQMVELRNLDALEEVAARIGWPVIIKPRWGSGSHGVVVLRSPADISEHRDWHAMHAVRGARTAATLVEEWIEGPEFGIDAAVVDGRFHGLCVRRKEVTPLPFRLATGVRTPPMLSAAQHARLMDAAARACAALGLDDCLAHIDIVLGKEDAPVIIELAGRPSGFRISSNFVPLVTGVDPAREMIRHCLGMAPDFAPTRELAGVMRMISCPPGRVVSVEGLERARGVPGIAVLECSLRPGDVARRADSGSSVLGNGHLIGTGATVEEALAACDRAESLLQIQVAELLSTP